MNDMKALRKALAYFQDAADEVNVKWEQVDAGGALIQNYPDYLPSFEQFVADVRAMSLPPDPPLPELPAAGTIVRARYNLDCGGQAHWPEGWTGEVVAFDGENVHVQAHRYIAGLAEWDNCRVIGYDDGVGWCEQRYGYQPDETVPRDRLVALALLAEFEVC